MYTVMGLSQVLVSQGTEDSVAWERILPFHVLTFLSFVDSNCVSIRLQKDAEHPTFGCIYSDEDRIDTLHAEDAARAVFHTAHWYIDTQKKGTQIFNVKDDSDLCKCFISPY